MDKDIESFITTLSNIGSRDDSLYDTLVRDSILEIVIKPPLANEVAISDATQLKSRKETENLNNALRCLLLAFERLGSGQSLESLIKHYVLSLPPNASQGVAVDEIFGDYFDKSTEGNRQLPAPIRNFFYSDKCYIILTIVPAIIVGLVMFAVTPPTLLYRLGAFIVSLVVFLGGTQLYEYLNERVQRYEGRGKHRST